jgi:hypothetical protein
MGGDEMGNLGAYQIFTTAAKKAGGVEALLKTIKGDAFGKGVKVGAVGGGLVVGGVVAVTNRLLKVREARAEEAEKQLKDLVRESTDLKDS